MVIIGIRALRILTLVILLTLCLAGPAQAATAVSGVINRDSTWTQQNSPYVIEADVTIAAQIILTIEAGVQVQFSGPYWLKVEGTLVAQGSADAPIEFRGSDLNTYWHRLEFLPGSDASILRYVSISNAGATSGSGSQAYGALYLAASSPQLSHLHIYNNKVTGLFAENISADLTLSDCDIANNANQTIAGVGAGGIFVEGTNSANITVRDSIIHDNRSNSHGGGLYISGAASLLIENNRIANNYAESMFGYGGGLYLANLGGVAAQNSIAGNTIVNNTADKDGGGIWMDESQVTINDNVLQANMALDSQGGALYIGDTSNQDTISAVSNIYHNLVFDNYSLELGGAIYIENGSHTIAGNVLYANTADDDGGAIANEQGGALMLRAGQITFSNNVVAENAASNGGAISIIGSGNLSNNSFAHNVSRHILRLAGNITVHGNTFADNAGELSIVFVPPQSAPLPVVNNNNFFPDEAYSMAYLVDNLNTPLLNAQSNWWGTIDEIELAAQVSPTIDYSGYTLEALTDTPIAPPKITDITYTADSASLVWVPANEADVVGYKVYWGENPAPQWDHVMDAGANTAIILSGLMPDKAYYFALTAYDDGLSDDLIGTPVNENQLSGNESWYSRPVYLPQQELQNNSGGGAISNLSWLLLFVYQIGANLGRNTPPGASFRRRSLRILKKVLRNSRQTA